MDLKYETALRTAVKKDTEEWFWRGQWCARRMLSAVVFRETAQSAFLRADSAILPVIGFYYSLFHAGIAALYLDYSTPRETLREMKHGRLVSLLNTKLIQRNLLPVSFSDRLKRLMKAREYCNYVVGGKLAEDFGSPIHRHDLDPLHQMTGDAFEEVITFLHEVSIATQDLFDFSLQDRVAVTIGDHIGDDVFSMYLGEADEDRVVDYLVETGLTT